MPNRGPNREAVFSLLTSWGPGSLRGRTPVSAGTVNGGLFPVGRGEPNRSQRLGVTSLALLGSLFFCNLVPSLLD